MSYSTPPPPPPPPQPSSSSPAYPSPSSSSPYPNPYPYPQRQSLQPPPPPPKPSTPTTTTTTTINGSSPRTITGGGDGGGGGGWHQQQIPTSSTQSNDVVGLGLGGLSSTTTATTTTDTGMMMRGNENHVGERETARARLDMVDVDDPGPTWIPEMLRNKSKADLEHVLSTPALLMALCNDPSASLHQTTTTEVLQKHLGENISLAQHVLALSDRLQRTHAETTSHLLRLHAQERAWKDKQAELDRALEKFSPKALYQRLTAAVVEQEALCGAMEESFWDGGGVKDGDGGGNRASEREVLEFLKRYRERREMWYLRREEKERWDEGRVGGWR